MRPRDLLPKVFLAALAFLTLGMFHHRWIPNTSKIMEMPRRSEVTWIPDGSITRGMASILETGFGFHGYKVSLMSSITLARTVPNDTKAILVTHRPEIVPIPNSTGMELIPNISVARMVPITTEASLVTESTEMVLMPNSTELELMPNRPKVGWLPNSLHVRVASNSPEKELMPNRLGVGWMANNPENGVVPNAPEIELMSNSQGIELVPNSPGMGWNANTTKIEIPNTTESDKSYFHLSEECKSLIEIKKDHDLFPNDKLYASLADKLPKLHPPDDFSSTNHPTRLQLMKGRIPFTSCQVHSYTKNDFGLCQTSRLRSSGVGLWAAFYGDSQLRNKLLGFLDLLPDGLEYAYYVGNEEVTRESFLLFFLVHEERPASFDIIGRKSPNATNGFDNPHNHSTKREIIGQKSMWIPLQWSQEEEFDLRLTAIWAPHGTDDYRKRKRKVNNGVPQGTALHEWASSTRVPDAVVIGYGLWFLTEDQVDGNLSPFAAMDGATRTLVDPVAKLASRTLVLIWGQSRYRWFNAQTLRQRDGRATWEAQMLLLHTEGTIRVLDDWMWRVLKSTGAIRWDSTVPFSVANLRECVELIHSGEGNSTFYKSRWWNCQDEYHTSRETIENEVQLLLNLLCNGRIFPKGFGGFCCA